MIIIIAALDEDRAIGKDNKLLWHLPEDMKYFRETTSGATVLMGRKTFQSIGKPLPNRNNIVISRIMKEREDVDVCKSIIEGLEKAKSYKKDVYIIGGEEIYKQTMKYADLMMLSHVKGKHDGDAFFPAFGDEWREKYKQEFNGFDLVVYERC